MKESALSESKDRRTAGMAEIAFPSGETRLVPAGTTLLELSREYESACKSTIVAAKVDNEIRETQDAPVMEIAFCWLGHGNVGALQDHFGLNLRGIGHGDDIRAGCRDQDITGEGREFGRVNDRRLGILQNFALPFFDGHKVCHI